MRYNVGMGIFEQSAFACIPDRSVWEQSPLHPIPFEVEALFEDAFLRRKPCTHPANEDTLHAAMEMELKAQR